MKNREFGIIMALKVAVIFLGMWMFTGCLSFGGGPQVDMQERGQRICEDTNGEWIDHRCVYPAWQLVDTPDTLAVLGTEA